MCQRVSCIFIRWFGHDGGTRHVWSVAWCSVTHRPHCFLGSGRELPPSNVRLKCPELASLWEITSPSWWPHRWRSLEEATRGSIHYLHRYKKENPGCGCLDWIWGLSSRASRLSPQAMVHCQYHPWGVRRVGCYLGGCLSLYPKNIVWGERGKKPSTCPAKGNARGGYATLWTPVCRRPNLCCDIVQL